MNRKEFLQFGLFGIGGMLLGKEKPPEENFIYLPYVSGGCSGDYEKLAEYVVPRPAGFAPGFSLVDFGEYRRFIIECSAKVASPIQWMPSVRINEDSQEKYSQHIEAFIGGSKWVENGILDRIGLPSTIYLDAENEPYWFELEIMNTPGFDHPYSGKGTMPFDGEAVSFFSINGVYRSSEAIKRIDVFTNFPTGLFGPGTVVSFYGVK